MILIALALAITTGGHTTMPRVKQVVARKDYPQFGIAKGEKHYNWSLKTGPRSSREYRQKTPPLPSQLTTSDYLGRLGDMQHYGISRDIDDAAEAIEQTANDLRELGDEQREKFDAMPDGLQQGDTGQMLEERADACDACADALETIAGDLRDGLDEIEKKEWHELDEFSDRDHTDPDVEVPDDDEIEAAKEGERQTLIEEKLDEADGELGGVE